MLFPAFGKGGYVKVYGQECPIYSWAFNANRERNPYRRAGSNNYPVRNDGLISNTLTITGVEPKPILLTSYTRRKQTFEIGWINLVDYTRNYISYTGIITSYELRYVYTDSNQPSFMWSVTYSGCEDSSVLQSNPISSISDYTVCAYSMCTIGVITTTDLTLNSGFVEYVTKATLKETIERAPYATSDNAPYYVENPGVYDRFLSFDIQGNFDYWLAQLHNTTSTPYNYTLFYDSGLFDYWSAVKMYVVNVNNFKVNVQTNEIISATVELAAGYNQ